MSLAETLDLAVLRGRIIARFAEELARWADATLARPAA